MTVEQIREAVGRTPFVPFEICVADGQKFRVASPEFIWFPPGLNRTFMVAEPPEHYHIIDLLMVTTLRFRSENGNGNGKENGETD